MRTASDPKDILSRVGRIACCFAGEPEFPGALAESGIMMSSCYLGAPRPCVGWLLWRRISWTRWINSLAKAAGVAREALSLDDGLENEAPEEFVDPLTAELMKSPVKLPSGNVVDDSTIRQHLLNELSDPFSRQPLEPADLEPLPDLKKRIEEWLAVKRAERSGARRRLVHAFAPRLSPRTAKI